MFVLRTPLRMRSGFPHHGHAIGFGMAPPKLVECMSSHPLEPKLEPCITGWVLGMAL